MPNSRRRRFSVHNGIAGRDRDHCKIQNNGMQSSTPACELETKANNLVSTKSSKSKNKIIASSSKNTNNMKVVAHCESTTSMHNILNSNSKTDKDVTASSSAIDLFNILHASFDSNDQPTEPLEKKESKRTPSAHEGTHQREKHREHRIKVRSPKRRSSNPSPHNPSKQDISKNDDNKAITDGIQEENSSPIIFTQSTGSEAINWNKEVEMCNDTSANVVETAVHDERQSDHSLDDMCRICHGGDYLSNELGPLISACNCRGTVGRVHVKCLERWLTESGKSRCELCGTRYATRRVHRYGVLRALVMWILSQNAKQLMVDSLGIMLMSPLAVLAAWLSGRTLAGLMTQDSHTTPWPLASTFVLACMTLVCYYCWIVSAATRHALGWWIWYKSQYEVRLTLDNEE